MTATAAESRYERACLASEVPAAMPVHVDIGGVPVALARCGDGQIRAIYDECSHAKIALSEGEVDDCTIECWLHGSRFDLRTGIPIGLPATKPVPVYPVILEGVGTDAVVLVDVTSR